jgi:hypothetical protein
LAHTFVGSLRKRYQGAQDKIRRTGSGSWDTRKREVAGDRLPMEHVHDHAWREFAFLKVHDRAIDARIRSLRDKGLLLFGIQSHYEACRRRVADIQIIDRAVIRGSARRRLCSMRRRGHGIHLSTDSLSLAFVARVRRNADYLLAPALLKLRNKK